MLGIQGLISHKPSKTWKIWIKHIMDQKDTLHLSKCGLFKQTDGTFVSATKGFTLPPKEILLLTKTFESALQDLPVDKLTINSTTYIVRERDENQLLAFNGGKYLIVCKTLTFLLIVVCESKSKCMDAALWLRKLSGRLVEKGF